jgi:putative phosphoesterase
MPGNVEAPVLIAIVADTHLPRGGRRIPDRCLETMRAADLILHAGDFVVTEVLLEIESLGPPVTAVHGNVDSEELRRRLPSETTVRAGNVRIAMVHDAGPVAGRLERLRRRFPDADAVVFGHSHMPLHEAGGGLQIFNPGSPTERRRAPRHTMGLARVSRDALAFELIDL